MKKSVFLLLSLLIISNTLFANNVLIGSVSLGARNTAAKSTMIRFNVGWENSWRTSTIESNYDAVWVFAKYRRKASNIWFHAFLNDAGHVSVSGTSTSSLNVATAATSTIEPGLVNTSTAFSATTNPAAGAFIYRSAPAIGRINFNVQLQWNYAANPASILADNDSVEICVYAIEMVNIPTGSFFVGDGSITPANNRFVQGTTILPFQITSESGLITGNTSTSELHFNPTPIAGVVPDVFPKGFRAFYCMKYELSQGMYREFLNKLMQSQQSVIGSNISINAYNGNNSTPPNRNSIKWLGPDLGGSIPRIYGNDLNTTGSAQESGDGEWIPVNFVSYDDMRAFSDWAGLRPISELEYEKACRGTLAPVSGEYAWGSITATPTSAIINSGRNDERASNMGANYVFNFPALPATFLNPVRCGSFAGPTTNRVQAGATYFGVMEMSGNLSEYCIGLSVAVQRAFNGNIHGDGFIPANGISDASWPVNSGHRGGSFNDGATFHQALISDRTNAAVSNTTGRGTTSGIRLGRTAQ